MGGLIPRDIEQRLRGRGFKWCAKCDRPVKSAKAVERRDRVTILEVRCHGELEIVRVRDIEVEDAHHLEFFKAPASETPSIEAPYRPLAEKVAKP